VAAAPNGDLAVAGDDGCARVFSAAAERQLPDDELASYAESIIAASQVREVLFYRSLPKPNFAPFAVACHLLSTAIRAPCRLPSPVLLHLSTSTLLHQVHVPLKQAHVPFKHVHACAVNSARAVQVCHADKPEPI
jgi:hypothetical protein